MTHFRAIESWVYQAIAYRAARYPTLVDEEALLADVACIALNRPPGRYVRDLSDCGAERSQDRPPDEARIETAVLRLGISPYVQAGEMR